ncbi:MAG: FliH/SctL family protein [Burkholderiales bacterium]|nr:FliH/SctL family protein [Burkholderiales bacterium]
MSELRKTPVRKQWMPNLMFDSETNDFAIQNLLEKEGPQFVAESEGRKAAAFVPDRLGREEEESVSHRFVAENADQDLDQEVDLGSTLHHPSASETKTTSPAEEANQLAAEQAARAQAEQQAAEQAAQVAAEQAAQLAEQQAAQAAAIAAAAEESVAEQEEVELIQAEQTPDLSNEAVTSLVEAAREEAHIAAHAEGHQQGFDTGYAQALTELKAEMDAKVTALQSMVDGIKELSTDADALFDPVKKLAVHLAEQLVRGELTQSGQVISRMVENCVREMSGSSEKTLIVHLNPDDLELYKPLAEQFGTTISLRPNSTLQRGSVRVSLDGAVVEDLIERRVQALSKSLKEAAPTGWRGNANTAAGNSLAARMESRQQDVETVAVSNATNTTNAQANENHESGVPPSGLDHD